MNYGVAIFSTLSDFPFASIFWILAAAGLIWLWAYCLKGMITDANRLGKESQALHTQLAQSIAATQQLVREKQNCVDPQVMGQVASLLDEAAEHLNPPIGDARLFIDIYLINWHRDGLALVDQAKKLIETPIQ